MRRNETIDSSNLPNFRNASFQSGDSTSTPVFGRSTREFDGLMHRVSTLEEDSKVIEGKYKDVKDDLRDLRQETHQIRLELGQARNIENRLLDRM